ncbi:hypothetical protein WJ968_36530 [Achromobacter xylosoxidans]
MLARLAPAAALLVLLSACAGMSEVTQVDKHTYSVTNGRALADLGRAEEPDPAARR